ncbi:MAG: hypothetical protein NVS4B11_07870 [Ktedonobacteraceae bacterium]
MGYILASRALFLTGVPGEVAWKHRIRQPIIRLSAFVATTHHSHDGENQKRYGKND